MTLTLADHYTLFVETEANDASAHWKNSIDIFAGTGAAHPEPTDSIVTAFFDFLVGIQRDDCTLVRAFLKPWTRGVGSAGAAVAIWDQIISLPCKNWGSGTCFTGSPNDGAPTVGELVTILTKNRLVGGGRKHHMSLRNVLWDGLVDYPLVKDPVIKPANLATVTFDIDAWAVAKLGAFLGGTAVPGYAVIDASVKHSIAPTGHSISDVSFKRVGMRDITNSSKK